MLKGAVTLITLLLTSFAFGARIIKRQDSIKYNNITTSLPQTHIHHLMSNSSSSNNNAIWDSFSSKVKLGWNEVANQTNTAFEKAFSDVKDGWDHFANKTTVTFESLASNFQNGWDVIANGTANTFQTVATNIQDSWEIVANKTVTSYQQTTSRIIFVFNNLYCPSMMIRNETFIANYSINSNNTNDEPFFYDNGETIQIFSCTAMKVLIVLGVSIPTSFGLAIAIPISFYLVVHAIGSTGYGVLLGSSAACCQSRMGNVAAGSWFAFFQSVATMGLIRILSVYENVVALFAIWILLCPLVGYLIWPFF